MRAPWVWGEALSPTNVLRGHEGSYGGSGECPRVPLDRQRLVTGTTLGDRDSAWRKGGEDLLGMRATEGRARVSASNTRQSLEDWPKLTGSPF